MARDMKTVLREYSQYCFAAHESALFLDTHPDCKAALDSFKKYTEKANELRREYEAKNGTLQRSSVSSDVWSWVNGPWPWETEGADY